jgi:hypothetical protein
MTQLSSSMALPPEPSAEMRRWPRYSIDEGLRATVRVGKADKTGGEQNWEKAVWQPCCQST